MGKKILLLAAFFSLLLGSNDSGWAEKLFISSANPDVNRVYRYDVSQTGDPTLELTITDGIENPVGISFSPEGEMFVANAGLSPCIGTGSVARFLNPETSAVLNGVFEVSPSGAPHWCTFKGNEFFVVEVCPGNQKVYRYIFDSEGNPLSNGYISEGLEGTNPRGITVSPWGEIFVSCGSNNIKRYLIDINGNALSNGVIDSGLNSPHGLTFSSWGELFVANYGDSSVSRYIFDSGHNASYNGKITGAAASEALGLTFSPWDELFVSSRAGGVYRWMFDASHNATSNGFFTTPSGLHDVAFRQILDTTPPTVTVTASPNTLWPPNHKMVDVTIYGSATDDGSGIASVEITVTDEYGIYNNMTVPGFGSTIQLEAWREGTDKNGRVYTITVVATDKAGNKTTATTQVICPHDMSDKK